MFSNWNILKRNVHISSIGDSLGIYWAMILIAGSPAFGLEALIFGIGDRISFLYGNRWRLSRDVVLIGLAIVFPSILIADFLAFDPLILSVLVFALTFVMGKALSLKDYRRSDSDGPQKKLGSEKNSVESMLKARGLEGLIYEKKEERPE